MKKSSLNQELSLACKTSSPDLKKIKSVIGDLKQNETLTPSLVSHCLVTVLSNRKVHFTRINYKSVTKTVKFLIKTEPRCLKEIIMLNHATQTPQDLMRRNSEESVDVSKLSTSREATKAAPRLTRSVPNPTRQKLQSVRKKKTDGTDELNSSFSLRKRFDSSAKDPSKRRESLHSHLQSTLDRARMRHDRFASVTSFEADFDPKLTVAVAKKSSEVKTLKSFSFTPLYTFFESMCFIPRPSESQYEDILDLQIELLKEILRDYADYVDVNFMLSVGIANTGVNGSALVRVKEGTELKSYQPLWHRLLHQGQFRVLEELIEVLEPDIRKTMFEVKTSVGPEDHDINFGMAERGLQTHMMQDMERREKFIISSKTALHEICSWPRSKWKSLQMRNGVSEDDALRFVEKLIEKGTIDVDAVCMRREQRSKIVLDLVRKYNDDKHLRMKKLPGKDVYFFIWQTPLSLAIRAKNEKLVRLLAKHGVDKEFGEVFYPRVSGIKFDPIAFGATGRQEEDEELGFKLAADLETVPTVYSLNEVYLKVMKIETNFQDWKYILNNDKLYDQAFAALEK